MTDHQAFALPTPRSTGHLSRLGPTHSAMTAFIVDLVRNALAKHNPVQPRQDDRKTETATSNDLVSRDDEIVIEIIDTSPAVAPELPSHFFPGSGSGSGEFHLLSGEYDRCNVQDAIETETVDPVQINHYDEHTHIGSFIVCDGLAPPRGTIIRHIDQRIDSWADQFQGPDQDPF